MNSAGGFERSIPALPAFFKFQSEPWGSAWGVGEASAVSCTLERDKGPGKPLALTPSTLQPDRNFSLGIPKFSTWLELARMGDVSGQCPQCGDSFKAEVVRWGPWKGMGTSWKGMITLWKGMGTPWKGMITLWKSMITLGKPWQPTCDRTL